MKKIWILSLSILVIVGLSGCSGDKEKTTEEQSLKVGIMLSEAGLGDQSFSDIAFEGMEKARDELNVSFDYRELEESGTYEQGLEELVAEGQDLIIGLGFAIQEEMEAVASKHPQQQFLLIDAVSEVPNIHNVTFKEDEGSYLLGALAAMKSKTGTVGFIGGVDSPVIHRFEQGFTAGVKHVNPEAKILSVYAGSFGDDSLGASIARDMIAQGADFLYPAAGFTGIGSILAAQEAGVYAFGVDSDQFFLAEHTVVSSMLKRVDTAVYQSIEEMVKSGKLSEKNKLLGIKEEGVSLAPIRVLPLTAQEQKQIDTLQEELSDGSVTITE